MIMLLDNYVIGTRSFLWERDIMSWERDLMSWEQDNHIVGMRLLCFMNEIIMTWE